MLRKWNFSPGSFINLQNDLEPQPLASVFPTVKREYLSYIPLSTVEDKMLEPAKQTLGAGGV